MIKRVISCLLAAVIMLSIINSSYAANVSDSTNDLTYKYEVLRGVGVIGDETTEDYGVFRDISKSSFINFLCNICSEYKFTIEHSDEAIRIAEGLGIIHKNQVDLYKPLSFDEAITMTVRLMGYGLHAERGGGFPHGYISIATRLGLTDGLEARSGQILQDYDAIKLLYNAVRCAYVEISGFTDDEIIYGGVSDKTVLYEFRKIYHIKGVLQSTGSLAITSDISLDPEKVIIDGYVYKAGEEELDELLGMRVEAFIRETDGYDEVLFVAPIDNEEITIDAENIVGTANNYRTIEYYSENGKVRSLGLSSIAAVVYNGQPIDKYTRDTFKPKQGNIRVIENNKENAGYDVVFITDYKTVIAESVLKSNFTVRNIYTYDATNKSIDLKRDGDDIVKIFKDHKEITFNDITADSVLMVKKSSGNGRKIVTVYVTENKISGSVSKIREKDDIVVTVDGQEYVLSEAFKEAIKQKDVMAIKPVVGRTYSFYLDYNGEIAFAKETSTILKYGIVMDATEEGTFKALCRVKIFTADGAWEILELADKVEFVDETGSARITSSQANAKIDKAADGKLSLIRYATNSKGQIVKLEKPLPYDGLDDDTFNYKKDITNNYRPNNQSFQSEIFVDDNAVLWFVRTGSTESENIRLWSDEESYSVHSIGSLLIDKRYTFSAYNVDRFNFADLFIVQEPATLASTSMDEYDAFVVDEVGRSLGEDGEVFGYISGIYGRYDLVTYFCKEPEMLDGLQRGDVITLHVNSRGYVDAVGKIYERKNGKEFACPDATTIHAVATKLHGIVKINSISNNRMKVDCGTGEWNLRTSSGNQVVIYDSKTDKLRRGSISEIEPEDFIVARLNRSATRAIVVYKNIGK